MIVMTDDTIERSLHLTEKDKLASICPPCYGPGLGHLPPGEASHVVCLDGNFQHRRHLAASIERGGIITPNLFLDPKVVEEVRIKMSIPVTDQGGRRKPPWHEDEVVNTF